VQIDAADLKTFLTFIGQATADPIQFLREVLPNQQRISVSLENIAPPKSFRISATVAAAGGVVALSVLFPDDGLIRVVRSLTLELSGFTAATVDDLLAVGVQFGVGNYTLVSDDAPAVSVIGAIETYSPTKTTAAAALQRQFPRIFYPKDSIKTTINVMAGTCGILMTVEGESFPPGCRPNFT